MGPLWSHGNHGRKTHLLISGFWLLECTYKEIGDLKERTLGECESPAHHSESSGREPDLLPRLSCDCYRNDFPYAQQNCFPHYTEWKTKARMEEIRMSLCPDYSPALGQG